jgi:hypothetical protein
MGALLPNGDTALNNRIRWLRISYWTGAIVDALACIPLVNSDV